MRKLFFKLETVVFLVALLIVYGFNHSIFFRLNDVLFAGDGDGIKNYYTYLYHAKHDDSFWDFTGMNYPFNEHIVYTDGHPLLSYCINLLGLSNYGIGILNFLMLISIPIAVFFLFKILKHYGVQRFWCFLSSITIAFMTPQLFRMSGHLSLSYSFAIPLMWWLLIQLTHSNRRLWLALYVLLLIWTFFTHPYLGLIISVFGLSYGFVFWLFNTKEWKLYLIKIGAPILFIIVLFQVIVAFTDSHSDRMKTPVGFFDYYADWNSLLFPHHGPFSFMIDLFSLGAVKWETWSYLGFFTIVLMVLALLFLIFNFWKLDRKEIFSQSIFKVHLAGFLVLLFSFCIPFKYEFFKPIVDLLTPLKQFRVLGRFTWVYFYVLTVSMVVFLQYLFSVSKRFKTPIKAFYILGITATFLEIIPAHQDVSNSISEHQNTFKKEHLSEELSELVEWTNQQNYDAVLFLPFTHLSSENIVLQGSEKASFEAMMLSFHTQTPLLNTVTSRTSVQEAVLMHNLFAPDYIEKHIFDHIPEESEIVVMMNKEELNPNEKRIVNTSELRYENDEFKVYHFSKENWNNSKAFDAVLTQNEAANHILSNNWRADTNEVWFFYEGFENQKSDLAMAGEGAFESVKHEYDIILDSLDFPTPGTYRCSFWYNMKVDRVNQFGFIEHDYAVRKSVWSDIVKIRESNLIVGDWIRASFDFEVDENVKTSRFVLSTKASDATFVIDEILIQKVGDPSLFKEELKDGEEFVVYNNDWISVKSFSH